MDDLFTKDVFYNIIEANIFYLEPLFDSPQSSRNTRIFKTFLNDFDRNTEAHVLKPKNSLIIATEMERWRLDKPNLTSAEIFADFQSICDSRKKFKI